LQAEETVLREKYEQKIKTFYANAFEWSFEFPEVLNDDGDFVGFDLIIGNPPYGVSIKDKSQRDFLVSKNGKVPDYEIYYWFINQTHLLLNENGICSLIIPNTILFNLYAKDYRMNLFDNWSIEEILDCTNFVIFKEATVRNIIFKFIKQYNTDKLTFRPTNGINDFYTLISQEKETVNKEVAKNNIKNWGLLFKLDNNTLGLIEKIKISKIPLCSQYDVTQGYIPYRKSDLQKTYGEEKANAIVKNREWHSDHKVNLEEKIDRLVYGLYGLTEEEIDFIENR
jgi:tRNA1(Val) A37 N6-methylase TrmN6